MVTYEITAVVRADLCDKYEEYMRERHIPDVLRTGKFAFASFSASSPGRYRIRYEARSRGDLDEYVSKHAPSLRQHFQETFPAGVDLSREEWSVLQTWTSDSAASAG